MLVASRHEVGHNASQEFARVEKDPSVDRVELVAVNEIIVLSHGPGEPIDGWLTVQMPTIVRQVPGEGE